MTFVQSDRRRAIVRQAVNKLRDSRRALAIVYLGGVCVKCGGTDRLEFHHKAGHKKVANVSHLWTRRARVVWEEIDKCELLCHKCHFEVTYYSDDEKGHV